MISLVVAIYNMRREAARTLYTLSTPYQRHIAATEYEVIVVENGSSKPLGAAEVSRHGGNFHYLDMAGKARPSPVHAVNLAARSATGDAVGIIMDGARMATPGLLAMARDALKLGPRTIACTLAWHLGAEHQSISCAKGYNQSVEDTLLDSFDWRGNGYRLFDHAAWAFSNPKGHFGIMAESCALFMARDLFRELGGYDEAFAMPGGGYATLDFFRRCCALPDARIVLLAGEGTFHQYHGGATTGAAAPEYGPQAAEEYRRIRGEPFTPPDMKPLFFGELHAQVLPWLKKSIEAGACPPHP